MNYSNPLYIAIGLTLITLTGCKGKIEKATPQSKEDQRREARGKLTGEGGISIFGGEDSTEKGGATLGVNSFLWRATLDTLSFMPFVSADPFGGVILTDWYENPKTPGERFKVNALILDKTLRSDGVRITLFKQTKDVKGGWVDQPVDASIARDLEDTILTRARELKIQSSSK